MGKLLSMVIGILITMALVGGAALFITTSGDSKIGDRFNGQTTEPMLDTKIQDVDVEASTTVSTRDVEIHLSVVLPQGYDETIIVSIGQTDSDPSKHLGRITTSGDYQFSTDSVPSNSYLILWNETEQGVRVVATGRLN